MRLTSAFMLGSLFGLALGGALTSLAWEKRVATQQAEIERLLAAGNKCAEGLHACEQATLKLRGRRK